MCSVTECCVCKVLLSVECTVLLSAVCVQCCWVLGSKQPIFFPSPHWCNMTYLDAVQKQPTSHTSHVNTAQHNTKITYFRVVRYRPFKTNVAACGCLCPEKIDTKVLLFTQWHYVTVTLCHFDTAAEVLCRNDTLRKFTGNDKNAPTMLLATGRQHRGGCIIPQAVTHSLVLLKMGKIISRNMLIWLELLISRYCCI